MTTKRYKTVTVVRFIWMYGKLHTCHCYVNCDMDVPIDIYLN